MVALVPLSKAEKRIARKEAKEADRLAKEARRTEQPDTVFIVQQTERVTEDKTVRTVVDPKEVLRRLMRWDATKADRKGTWTWGIDREWGDEVWNRDLHPKLQNFATMKWTEIEAARVKGKKGKTRPAHHSQELSSICKEAQDRAKAIELVSDILFRFRIANTKRLWGYRFEELFYLVWYDPTHQIFPTDLN